MGNDVKRPQQHKYCCKFCANGGSYSKNKDG